MKLGVKLVALAIVTIVTIVGATAPSVAGSLKVTTFEGDALAEYNQSTIEEIGLRVVETETPWTDGIIRFEGVSLKAVLNESGIEGKDVTGLAIDDYAATLPVSVIETYDPIIATRMNGELMTVDNKGPFWIMFDFDDIAEEESVELRSFAVWHLNELEVE